MNPITKTVLSMALASVILGAASVQAQLAASLVRLAADDHAGHAHDEKSSKGRALGSKEIAGYTVKVMQESDVKAGGEGAFAIVLSGKNEKPKAIRAWVGVQSAEGSTKGKAVAEGDEWHAHVEVPDPIPAKSQFWVEIETAAGKVKAAFDYK